jgi:hypothetical protein
MQQTPQVSRSQSTLSPKSEPSQVTQSQIGMVNRPGFDAGFYSSGPTWLNLVFRSGADFGEGVAEVVG